MDACIIIELLYGPHDCPEALPERLKWLEEADYVNTNKFARSKTKNECRDVGLSFGHLLFNAKHPANFLLD